MEEILALDMQTLRAHTLAAGQVFDEVSHRAALKRVLPKSKVVKVFRKERLAGYVYLWPKGDGLWFVGGFAVHPGFRFGNVLRALLRAVEGLVISENIRELQSHVYKTNARSLALHRRLGYEVVDENEKGYAFSLKLAGEISAGF